MKKHTTIASENMNVCTNSDVTPEEWDKIRASIDSYLLGVLYKTIEDKEDDGGLSQGSKEDGV